MTTEKLDNELTTSLTVRAALEVEHFLWPEFVREHGCIFLAKYAGSNPPPPTDTATGWESFINHTHIFDEFRNEATKSETLETSEVLDFMEENNNEVHPDFIAACELGRTAAKLWATKLKRDFPMERFRVYYTEYDNPIVRFHKVRDDEPVWLSDQALQAATDPSFRNSLVYDTMSIEEPILGRASAVQ